MSSSSVFYDRNRQVMRCFGCVKTHEVMSSTARNPEAMFDLKQKLTEQHAGCMRVPTVAKIPVTFQSTAKPVNPSLVEAHRLLWGEGSGL